MPSRHHPQVNWSSFLLLSLVLFLEFPSPVTSGRCEERCDNNRLPGSTNAYILNCEQVYSSPGDIRFCRQDCPSCPNDICKSSNPSIFRCPPNVRYHQRCKEHCDSIRPSSYHGAGFNLTCSLYYSSKRDIEKCQSYCTDCPREICVGSTPDKYACPHEFGPAPPISGHCLNRCNNNRPKGSTGAYTLSCLKEYATVRELNFCRKDCWFCPSTVCNTYNPDIFHCPAGRPPTTTTTTAAPIIWGRCKQRCDDNRPQGTTTAYTLDCRRAYEFADEIRDCAVDCRYCDRIFCNPNENENIYHCPKISKPLPPPPPPTYEGPCQDRCDNNRDKGPYGLSNDAYTLNCDQKYGLFSTESKRCRRDCQKCSKDVCDPDTNRNLHHCPRLKLQKRCDDMCSANRKLGSFKEYTLKCSTEYTSDFAINYCKDYCQDCENSVCNPDSDNNTYHCPRAEKDDYNPGRPNPYPGPDPWNSRQRGQTSTLAIAGLVIVLLILVGCVGACIYCCVRKKHTAQTGQFGAPSAGVYPTAGGQFVQQQPYPMPYNYAASQPSVSSFSGASTSTFGQQQPRPMYR